MAKKLATEQRGEQESGMEAISQGEDMLVQPPSQIQHFPTGRDTQRAPKKPQNNTKQGKKGRWVSYQSPQRPRNPGRGGQQGKHVGWIHPQRQGGNHEWKYAQQYNQGHYQTYRASPQVARGHDRAPYNDYGYDMQYNQAIIPTIEHIMIGKEMIMRWIMGWIPIIRFSH